MGRTETPSPHAPAKSGRSHMPVARPVFYNQEAKENYDRDLDIPVFGEGDAENWRLLTDVAGDGFAVAEAPGDADLHVTNVQRTRELEDWKPSPSTGAGHDNCLKVGVPTPTGKLIITIVESNAVPDGDPSFANRRWFDDVTHAIEYELTFADDEANFVGHVPPNRACTTERSERINFKVRELADKQVEERENYLLGYPAGAVVTEDPEVPEDQGRTELL